MTNKMQMNENLEKLYKAIDNSDLQTVKEVFKNVKNLYLDEIQYLLDNAFVKVCQFHTVKHQLKIINFVMLDFLLKGINSLNPNIHFKDDLPLRMASKHVNWKIMNTLLERGSDVSRITEEQILKICDVYNHSKMVPGMYEENTTMHTFNILKLFILNKNTFISKDFKTQISFCNILGEITQNKIFEELNEKLKSNKKIQIKKIKI